MFYVQKPEMVNKTFRLPEELVNRLSAVAQQQGVSMNNLVAQCCNYALNDLADSPQKDVKGNKKESR